MAIIGSGVSGLVSAHLLHRHHEITLYEANTLFAQRRNLARPSFIRLLADIPRFNRAALRLLGSDDLSVTLAEFLDAGGATRYVERLIVSFRNRIRLGSPVRRVERDDSGVNVFTDDNGGGRFYSVVLATHATAPQGHRGGEHDGLAVLHGTDNTAVFSRCGRVNVVHQIHQALRLWRKKVAYTRHTVIGRVPQ